MSNTSRYEQAFRDLAAESNLTVDQIKAMTWEEFEQLHRQTLEAMMEAERELFTLKSAQNASVKATDHDPQEFTVPAHIVTEWAEDGEAEVFKPVELATDAEIRGHIDDLRSQVEALQSDIASLARYVVERSGDTATDAND